jgi:bacterioferritin
MANRPISASPPVPLSTDEMMIGRILFLEGNSTVSKINPMYIGNSVEDQVNRDYESETGAVVNYNAAIAQAGELGDNSTRHMLTSILKDEKRLSDWLEAQKDQIAQMGIQRYLSLQVKE